MSRRRCCLLNGLLHEPRRFNFPPMSSIHFEELAVARQDFEKLLAMCEPAAIRDWRPTSTQRALYIELADSTLNAADNFRSYERRKLLSEGSAESYVPEALHKFLAEELSPKIGALSDALDYLDPEGKTGRDLLMNFGSPRGAAGRIRKTFIVAVDQVNDLIERNNWEAGHPFFPEAALQVLESELIQFDPDSWLDRAGQIAPVRTINQNFKLPIQIRTRLEEANRAFVFGCWVAVIALCRALLEYAIHDNLHKMHVDEFRPPGRDGKRRRKDLVELIEDVAAHHPGQRMNMESIREAGNEYLHPTRSQTSKEILLQREANAKQTLVAAIAAIESLYGARTSII